MPLRLNRLFPLSFLFTLSAFASVPARAEWDHWALKAFGPFDARGIGLYRVDSASGSAVLMTTRCDEDPGVNTCYQNIGSGTYTDSETGKFFLENENGDFVSYDPVSDSWTEHGAAWTSSYSSHYARPSVVGTDDGAIKVELGGTKIYERKSNGEIHIGENSLVTKEEGGRQKLYATDSSSRPIDIDITNGSRLLINGRDVEKSIDNVGALSAALGSVPALSADSQFTCGFGGGTHSSAYALSAGCASRVSNRISVNAALATVINNHTGDADDNLSGRAGFTFRLGKIDDSPKVAARKAAELHDKVAQLEESNQALAATNQSLMELLQAQSARLDNLEEIASGQLSPLGDRASSD